MKDQMEPVLYVSPDPSSFILSPSSFPPWLLIAWIAAMGGVIGSFLNVVVYRLPAGLSIVHPGSHCPKCNHPIRWFDNVPVLSWFLLRGRCRDCHAPISIRYPLVEAATMLMFLLLAVAELFTGGANLPRAGRGTRPGSGLGDLRSARPPNVHAAGRRVD